MDIDKTINSRKKEVDKAIKDLLKKEKKNYNTHNSFILKAIEDFIHRGGKRIRPVASVMAYETLKAKTKKIFLPSAALEFVHNSTLCHDDVMDEDPLRRNGPSCHKLFEKNFTDEFRDFRYKGEIFSTNSTRFGTSMAILSGNLLIQYGYKCISESKFDEKKKSEVIKRLNEVLVRINQGQVLDIYYEKKGGITKEHYIEMIRNKTAELLGFSFEMGAILAGADKKTRNAFYGYGLNLGIAFQIADDLLDVDETSMKGNTFASDIKKGKKTILTLHAMENCPDHKRNSLRKKLEKSDCTQDDILHVIKLYKECETIGYAQDLAIKHINLAKKSISKVTDKEEFYQLSDYVLERKK